MENEFESNNEQTVEESTENTEAAPERSMRDIISEEYDRLATDDDEEGDESSYSNRKQEEDLAWQQHTKEKNAVARAKSPANVNLENNGEVEAPHGWKIEAKQAWSQTPPVVKNEVVRRERELLSDYTRKTQQIAEVAKYYQAIDQAIAPYKAELAREGKSLPQVVERLLQWDNDFRQDKYSAARALLASYDIEPDELLGYDVPKESPEVMELRQETEQLKAWIAQQQQLQQQSNISAVSNVVEQFRSAQDENGDPAHPYWEYVEDTMAGIIPALRERGMGHQEALTTAYKMALQAHPDVSAQIEQFRQQKFNARRIKTEKDKAQRARTASQSITGSAPSGRPLSSVPRDRRDLIAGLMEGSVPLYGE